MELRRALVATVDAAPFSRRLPRRRLTSFAIAAFVLAGAATGGAVASVPRAGGELPTPEQVHDSGLVLKNGTVPDYATLYGTPFNFAASGTMTLNVGRQPEGATALAFGLDCLEAGTFEFAVDGTWFGSVTCDERDADRLGGGGWPVEVFGGGTHIVKISGAGQFVVWAQWMSLPALLPSSTEQREAMADGVVTREEYVAGFQRFVTCIEAGGWHVDGDWVGDNETVISYALPSGAVDDGTERNCYGPEFEELDTAWQQAHASG